MTRSQFLSSILTRFVDFKPHAYAPAAFADWVEPAEN